MIASAVTTGYPFLDVFLTILIVFAWIVYIWVAITVLIDIFRRHDLSGWGKAAWVIVIVVVSWFGVLIYLILNHGGMAERRAKDVQDSQAQLDNYVRSVAGSGGATAEIERAKRLLDSGAINQAEFDSLKAQALGSTAGTAPGSQGV